jgi:hypothetical protein
MACTYFKFTSRRFTKCFGVILLGFNVLSTSGFRLPLPRDHRCPALLPLYKGHGMKCKANRAPMKSTRRIKGAKNP